MKDINEARLAQRVQRGDREAWGLFCDTTLPVVYRYVAERLNGRAHLADDILQETYTLALDRIAQFDPERGHLGQWVLGIARKRVAEHYRRQGRAAHFNQALAMRLRMLDSRPLPDEMAEEAELRAAGRMALGRLSTTHREVLLDRYEHSLSLEEIAARGGRSRKSVESLLHRARHSLRQALTRIGGT